MEVVTGSGGTARLPSSRIQSARRARARAVVNGQSLWSAPQGSPHCGYQVAPKHRPRRCPMQRSCLGGSTCTTVFFFCLYKINQ